MTVGIRVRDQSTGVVRLASEDFTVRVVYSQVMPISGNGSLLVQGVTSDNAGAFLIPAFQTGWPYPGEINWTWAPIPKMPVVVVGDGVVRWTIGAGQTLGQNWHLLVVRYK